MRTTQHLAGCVLVTVTICLLAGVRSEIHAQQPNAAASPLMVGITGTADVGAFDGTFLLTRFAATSDNRGLVAVGSAQGALSGRNVVTKLAIPVTVAASPAVPTAVVGAPVMCGVRVGFERSAFPVLGSVVTLARSGFDITAPQAQAATGVTLTPSSLAPAAISGFPVSSAASGLGVVGSLGSGGIASAGTAVPTAPVGSATPGVISPQTVSPLVTPSPQQLGQLLCSVAQLSQSSAPPAQLAAGLNQVMLALQ